MLRKLFILACLFSTANAIAQHNAATPPKTTEKKTDPVIDYKQMGAPMPPFKMFIFHDTSAKKDASAEETRHRKKKKHTRNNSGDELTQQYLTTDDLDNGANTFVMMFNPTCSHCEDETALLEKNIGLFKKSKLALLANPNMATYIPDFYKRLHIDQYPAITVGVDSALFINNVFLYQILPQINIYNGDHKLIKTYSGEVAIDSLSKYIQ